VAENLKQIIEFQAKGIERLKGQYKDLERRTKGLEGSTGRASGAMGGMIAKLGLTTVALYGTMRAISAVVRVGKEFEKNMSNVAAISGASGAELAALEKNAQKLGETTVFTASNVASLQVEFAKLGFSAKEITGVTKDTLALASATGSDLATSAAVAGQTLRAFGLDVNETSRITDTMAASFSASALDMDKFTNSMQYVAPIAKQIGIDVEGTTAILGTLANAGISGSMAGTSLRKILLELGNESSALTKKIGFSVKNSDDLTRAFAKLNTMGLGTAEMKDLVGQRAISAFNILLEGTSTTSKLTEELRNSSGAAQEMADVQLDNLEGKMTLLNSATEGLGIALFDLADDSISSVVTALTSLASVMTTVIKFGLGGLQKASEDTSDALSQMMIQTNEQAFEFKQLTTELLGLTKQTDLSNRQLARRIVKDAT
jgi:TP901 family phage tail tape measure protein